MILKATKNAFKSKKHGDFERHMSVNKNIMPVFALFWLNLRKSNIKKLNYYIIIDMSNMFDINKA